MRYIIILMTVFLWNCSIVGNPVKNATTITENTVNVLTNTSQGFLLMTALVELNSNFSSLIFDKTDVKYKNYVYADYGNHLTYDKFRYYVMPEKMTKLGEVTYSENIKTILERVIIANRLGEIVQKPEKADFIILVSLVESYEKLFGENSSDIEMTILSKDNRPIMWTKVTAVSKSDENFFYYPSKSAKSVKYLTVKGLNYLLEKSFTKIFLEG
ncbi:MAG: hypothetical protein N3C60_07030 [Calditerrivibrio sp.]|nr:hypothetical protein [Calditerrivibrio sp.]